MRFAWMGYDWRMCRNLHIWYMFWTNKVMMRQSVIGRWRVEGGMQVLLDLWQMLGVCRLSVLWSGMNHCSCLFLCMVVRQ